MIAQLKTFYGKNYTRNEWRSCENYTPNGWRRSRNYTRNEWGTYKITLETSVVFMYFTSLTSFFSLDNEHKALKVLADLQTQVQALPPDYFAEEEDLHSKTSVFFQPSSTPVSSGEDLWKTKENFNSNFFPNNTTSAGGASTTLEICRINLNYTRVMLLSLQFEKVVEYLMTFEQGSSVVFYLLHSFRV